MLAPPSPDDHARGSTTLIAPAPASPTCPWCAQVAQYIVAAGGKRLRPALLLLACGALGYRGDARADARRGDRVHPHRHPAARRRGRRVGAAPRARDRQRRVRQRRRGAGRRFPLLARLPDDGRGRQHARDAGAGRCHQHHRRRRSAAAHGQPRPRRRRGALPRGDPPQDREALRGGGAAGRDARAQRPRGRRRGWPTTARISARRSS